MTTPAPSNQSGALPGRRPSKRLLFAIAATVLTVACTVTAVVIAIDHPSSGRAAAADSGPAADGYRAPTSAEVADLPAATYDAVIPGLVAWDSTDVADIRSTATIGADVPLYGEQRDKPVARLTAKNFLNEDTVVVPVRTDGLWTLVLTPSRQQLPSKSTGKAAAQSAGWVRTADLRKGHKLEASVTISVSEQTLTIRRGEQTVTYNVGVGTETDPTPTNVTGYLQARYLDPKQGQSKYPIQLTSLHSATSDEPYRGDDGGLIGAHYADSAAGQVSHGCIRLPFQAVAAVNQLPLGTPITIID